MGAFAGSPRLPSLAGTLKERMMDIKNGVRTTEFWVTLVTLLAGLAKLFGLDIDAGAAGDATGQAAGGLMALAAVVGYPISRGLAKKGGGEK